MGCVLKKTGPLGKSRIEDICLITNVLISMTLPRRHIARPASWGRWCRADLPLTPTGRLENRQQQLKALAQSVDAISPLFSI
jgi:hypothetical protein